LKLTNYQRPAGGGDKSYDRPGRQKQLPRHWTAGRGVHLVNEPVAELQHFRTEAAFWNEALKMKEKIEGDKPICSES